MKIRKRVMAARYELSPKYDSRASFYGKAHVEHEDDGSITLYSYNTPVVTITPDKQVQLLDLWDSSQTTLRHVKEFLQQNGFSVGSKAQLAKMYSSTRLSGRKRVIAASKRAIRAAAYGHNPWEQIELSKPAFIAQWQSESEGEPDTSWDNIFENALEDFKLYADDEASGNILDEFIEGDFDEIDMCNEFEQFIMWKDLADYDQ